MINEKLPAIFYGGDYNPDQWDEETIKEDMRMFKLAGINLVTFPVFSWAKIQPSEDVYDFVWLDKLMDIMAENDIYVNLATSTAAQPAWMSRKYTDIMPVDQEGRKRVHGKRVNFCYNSPSYRKFAKKIAIKMAQRYKDHPALLLWHIANEYGTYCYCENCQKAFRQWAKDRYKTIEEVNKRWNLSFWGHTIYDWEDITVPSKLNDNDTCAPQIELEYLRFITDSSIECYRNEYDAIKRVTPNIPITTNLSGFIKKLDQFKWAPYYDIIGWDNYPWPIHDKSIVALKHDLMRGLKDGKPYMVMEQSPSQQNWQAYNQLKAPGEMRMLAYQSLAHGADTVLYFQLRRSIAGVEKLHGAIIEHCGHENTRVFKQCSRLGKELKDLEDKIIDSRIDSKVAIMFDWDNWWSVELSSGPSKDLLYFETITKFYKSLHDQNVSVDIVRCDLDLSKYDVVYAPLLYMVKPGVDENIREFVKNGGTFISSYFSGIVDENDRAKMGYPGKLRDILGIWVEEIDALPPYKKNVMVVKKPFGDVVGTYECGLLCDLLHLEGAISLAEYGKDFYKGMPALTVNNFGKGKAYYIATDAGEGFLDSFSKFILKENSIGSILTVPKDVEVTKRTREDKEYIFVINHNKHEVDIDLKDTKYTEIITSKVVTGRKSLESFGVMILEK